MSAAGSYGWRIGPSSEDFINNERDLRSSSSDSNASDDGGENNVVTSKQGSIAGHYWCESGGQVPSGAVKAGVDKDGGDVYVGRAFHHGEVLPAKVIPNQQLAFVAHGGEEHAKSDFEVLCRGSSMVIWHEASEGVVPPGSVTVGTTSEGERLYIGRVFHDGTLTPGKIHPSHGVCYIPYGGQELSFPKYEALVLQ